MFRIVLAMATRFTMSAALSLCLTLGAAHAEDFLSVLDDMPLAPGLTELADQAAEFETPAGRIIDAAAAGTSEPRTVSSFYDRTLPALGWTRNGAGRFVREHEQLTIATGPGDAKGQVVVRFSLRPRQGAVKH